MNQAVFTASLLFLSVMMHLRCAGSQWDRKILGTVLVHVFLVTATNMCCHAGASWSLSGPVTVASMLFAVLGLLCGQLLDVRLSFFPVIALSRERRLELHLCLGCGVALVFACSLFLGRIHPLHTIIVLLVLVLAVVLTSSDPDACRRAFFVLDSFVVLLFLCMAAAAHSDGIAQWQAVAWMLATLKGEFDANMETLGASEEE